jgi:hypothetical protein
MDETLTFFKPFVDNLITLVRLIFVCISAAPFIKGPCMGKYIAKGPWTGKILGL